MKREKISIRKPGRIKVHVNQHVIRSNRKHECYEPMITIKAGRRNYYCHEVEFPSGSVLVSKKKPLSCGARVWIEAEQVVAITHPYTKCGKKKK